MRIVPNDLFFEQIEAMLAEGHDVQIIVKGHSMRPLLRNERDRVVLTPVGGEAGRRTLRIGDIVLFRYRGRHILHRIINSKGDRLTLAGDGNYGTTEHCTPDDVLAVVTKVVRRSGRTIPIDSRRWQRRSRCWVTLPLRLRKFVLRVLWHMGIK